MSGKSWRLLTAPLGIIVTGFLLLYFREVPLGISFLPWLVLAVALTVFTQALLIASRPQPNLWLFPCVVLLISMGLVTVARLSPELLIPQLRWLIIGLSVFIFSLRLSDLWIGVERWQYIWGIICLILLCLPFAFGTEIGGSRNWIVLGSFSIQPSELGKIFLVLFLASYLAEHRHVLSLPNHKVFGLMLPPLRFVAPLLVIWGLAVIMFALQRDLGAALLFFSVAVIMTYMATGSKSAVFVALLVFLDATIFCYFEFPHVTQRFDIWLDPWSDPTGDSYQLVQSLFAFAAGGVWGTGFAHGHPGLIPEVHTDFVFAAIAEEWGLIGAVGIMSVYVLFFYEGIRVALNCVEDSQVLLAAGAVSLFFCQTFIIIGGVTGFLPLTGVTLPFISYGGSSMVSGFLLLGILVSLSRKEQRHGH